jgi:hypothetical protein
MGIEHVLIRDPLQVAQILDGVIEILAEYTVLKSFDVGKVFEPF